MEIASGSAPGSAVPLTREERVWAGLALSLSVLEAPVVYLLWRGLGPLPLAWPRTPPGAGGDLRVDLSLAAAGFSYFALWIVMLLGLGAILRAEALGRLWTRSFFLLLAVGLHTLAHFAAPWLLIVTDRLGVTPGWSLAIPGYLNPFQPSVWRFLELPALTLGILLTSRAVRK